MSKMLKPNKLFQSEENSQPLVYRSISTYREVRHIIDRMTYQEKLVF